MVKRTIWVKRLISLCEGNEEGTWPTSTQLERLLTHSSCEFKKIFEISTQSCHKAAQCSQNTSISVSCNPCNVRSSNSPKIFVICATREVIRLKSFLSILFQSLVCFAISPLGMFVNAFGESFKFVTFARVCDSSKFHFSLLHLNLNHWFFIWGKEHLNEN